MPTRSVRLRIHGLVQGVSYRASARAFALELGVLGWVRNLSDGDVEAHAEGDAERVGQFVAWCQKGPALARVESVSVDDVAAERGSTFEVRR